MRYVYNRFYQSNWGNLRERCRQKILIFIVRNQTSFIDSIGGMISRWQPSARARVAIGKMQLISFQRKVN
jgi:hypothetical protein